MSEHTQTPAVMRELRRVEMAAIWFYHDEYTAQNLSAIDFHTQLPLNKKILMQQMVDEICEAQP